MSTDFVSILEACYRRSASLETWLDGVHAAVRPTLGSELGLVSFASEGASLLPSCMKTDCDPDFMRLIMELSHAVERPENRGVAGDMRARLNGRVYSARGETMASSADWNPEFLERRFESVGVGDCWVVGFSDPAQFRFGCLIPRRKFEPPVPLSSELEKIGVHLLAGLRLADRPLPEPSAWFSPDGKVVEASADAFKQRDVLTLAVQAIDRARTRQCRSDGALALDLWCGLVDGRWSLVEVTESDGRRLIVAVENDPKVAPMIGLSARETQVAVLLAMGYSEKLAAYGLGLSAPTLSSHVSSACRKLRLASRVELVSVVASLIGVASRQLQ